MENLKKEIIHKSIDLGISDIKFTNSNISDSVVSNYSKWLELGYNAQMKYLENQKDKRSNPNLILENVKSIIVCALNYFPGNHPTNLENVGKVARYAIGKDYHIVFKDKLIELANFILEREPASQAKVYVDTGAILERYWAEKAGLGWQGKNGNIISTKFGSYFFIGIIFSTIEFEPDEQISNHCGKCTLCLTHCPTNAIVQPKVIDSNKCIAYWTIEAKPDFEIPENIQNANPDWIFGCDICQEVCPWNKKYAIKTTITEFLNLHNLTLELEKILLLEQDEFSKQFKNSPIKRTKLSGLKRNAMALINSKNEKSKGV